MAMRLGDDFFYLKRHILALIVGLAAMYAGYRTRHFELPNISVMFFLISVTLLLLAVIPGVGVGAGGATRWIKIGFISFQPAEIAKLALIIYIAAELAVKRTIKELFPLLGMILIMLLLVIKEPDIGTTAVLALISFSMFFLAGVDKKYILYSFGTGAAAAALLSIAEPYRMRRLTAFLSPWQDPQGGGFHIIQSLIAVGSGGLFGLGLGQSKQKFFYLPQNYTDFIFAIFCEEIGLIGAIGLTLLFFLFVARGLKIVRNAPDDFSMLLAGGIVSWIGLQAFLNICVVLSLVPTTGIPLPFISYGGTAMVVALYAIGLLLNISSYKRA